MILTRNNKEICITIRFFPISNQTAIFTNQTKQSSICMNNVLAYADVVYTYWYIVYSIGLLYSLCCIQSYTSVLLHLSKFDTFTEQFKIYNKQTIQQQYNQKKSKNLQIQYITIYLFCLLFLQRILNLLKVKHLKNFHQTITAYLLSLLDRASDSWNT